MFLKKISLLLVLITAALDNAMAQKDNNYTTQWKKVEALEKKGLPASALKEVLAIYKLSVKDNNDAQQVKSCIYQIRYRSFTEEQSQEKSIFFVDTLIAKATAPARNILLSMQAEMYWQYLQNNRWKFYSRSRLLNEKSKDISTWSLDKLQATITQLYNASITAESETILKHTRLDGFDPVLIRGENTRNLRPTLYDFLAFRALEYFMTDEHDITKPAYHFTINDPIAFAPATEFIQHRFITTDSSSLHYHALQLLRNILAWHIADAKKDALLDADLIRLNFVNQYSIIEDKEKLFEAGLKNLEEKYYNHEAAAQAMYLRAKIYYNKGQGFDPITKTDNQYEIKRAKELCESAIAKFPQSEGGINALNLLNSILQPTLSLETEKVNVPQQPFRTLVKYKNVKTVYFRLIKTTREAIKKLDREDYEKRWQGYIALKPLKSWSIALPDPLDYQGHSAEVSVAGLVNGTYYILASIDEDFSLQKNIIAKQLTYVSNISYIHNNDNEYYVLDRDNGQPLVNAKIQLWESKYDYTKSQYTADAAEQYITDQNGYFKIKKTNGSRTILLQIGHGKDELFLDENDVSYYTYDSYQQPPQQIQTFLFTDRSIYRPGQTVYFKGIVIKKGNKAAENKVFAAFKSTIQLKDANGQSLSELSMTTNDYGSYHGSFKLPEGSLNGQFSLNDSAANGYHAFSVEEYKRPKFSVEIKKPAGTYRLNDSIKVTGTAQAYAGNHVDGAAVKYRVVRKVRYPVWWGYGSYIRKGRGIPYGRNEEVEITNGTGTTDNKGEFDITFRALPDESIPKKDQPIFYYEVSADITDLNGETRSGETSVAVAYQSLQLEIKIDDRLPADSLKNILVRSTNLNDIEEKATITVSIQQLISPGKIFRERYWDQPDQFVMSRDEYYSYFPYDVYKNENEVKYYATGEKLVEKTGAANSSINIRTSAFAAGWYKIMAVAKDKSGEEVRTERYLQLTGNETAGDTDPVTVNIAKGKAEPGEKISYDIKTGFDNIWLIHALSKMDSSVAMNLQALAPAKPYKNEIAVSESDRGGMAMSYAFVKHNRVYTGNENFDVPWSNKELNIMYQTFRDKLLPGANEKWTVKISGHKGEKAAAEILAGMYDASLDQFVEQKWHELNIWPGVKLASSGYDPGFFHLMYWDKKGFDYAGSELFNRNPHYYSGNISKEYDKLLKPYGGDNLGDVVVVGYGTKKSSLNRLANAGRPESDGARDLEGISAGVTEVYDSVGNVIGAKVVATEKPEEPKNGNIQIRKNFNETAFFFPDLTTDAEGNTSFSFTMPEALTQWKLMTLAHSKELASGYSEKTVVTQKPLMVQPNAPRFMRAGDRMEFSAKIVNLSDSEITGTATLELLDAASNQPVDGWFKNVFPIQSFTVKSGQSSAVKFPVEIPFNFNSALSYRIVAKSALFSDGEEMALPVLSNRMLVTESMPLNLRNTDQKDFRFEKLINSGNSQTISNHALTVEYTSNPAWYAVQALPYLMEYPYECAEQTFNRYYANTLASFISASVPAIKSVFEKWKTTDSTALLSNLQKNEALKSALLQETPWVLDAKSEAQQKKNIALLFDMVRMSSETAKSIDKLKEMQSENGGFVWFKGGPDDRYITQYIVTGIGHLRKLNALSPNETAQLKDVMGIVKKSIPYLDQKIKEDYDYLLKHKTKLSGNHLSDIAIQYLYMRSLFTETAVPVASQKAYNYYLSQSKQYWLSTSKYMQAMTALVMHRNKDHKTATDIIRSLKENSISSEEMGRYWKEWNNGGWFWHQAPVESQAMMIEVFTEIDQKQATIDELKTWLLKQKQTQNWKTTRATAEACYALLLNGSNWLKAEKEVTIRLGNSTIRSSDERTEAGTGYFKKRIEGDEVKPEMGNIKVSIKSAEAKVPPAGGEGGSWGSVYWQYFEDLDKISPAETPLKLVKKLFVERNSDRGPLLEALEEGASIKVGDKIIVRIELKVDRDMEYVHMKDLRAACLEPVNVISGYHYQGGLGYYESTGDASTNFFFSWLNKGSYVFEYPLLVTHQGNFSNGITTIQCMYAPEFTSHSEGVRITVQ